MSGKATQVVNLSDGRSLGYDEYGARDGAPILYFHGVPSSRLDVGMFATDDLIAGLGARVVAVDRPGCGRSDFQRGRRLEDWPADVLPLADRLGLEEFSVLGWSGGGPYALACAAALPDRVRSVAVVSGIGPFQAALSVGMSPTVARFFRLNRDRPILGRAMDRLMTFGAGRRPTTFLANTGSALPPIDRLALETGSVGRAYIDAVIECGRQGAAGAQLDARLVAGEWGLDLGGITQTVQVWHGHQDTDAPLAMARHLASVLQHAKTAFLPDEGHLSLIINHAQRIMSGLLP